jgi:glycosyltransferase involved in cell wall biosynthesis
MKVTVVIPALNAAPFVRDAVSSVLAQRGLPGGTSLEVIVVDNGSTDGTADIVRDAYGARVRIVTETAVQGIGPARNAGIAIAGGDAIALLDADDIWMPDKLALQLGLLESQPAISLVFCHGAEFADPPGSARVREQPVPFLIGSALLARREALAAAGPFPRFRSGEFIAWYGWTQALGLASHVLPDTLVRRRVHANNCTRDRSALEDYPRAMQWQLERRRALARDRGTVGD